MSPKPWSKLEIGYLNHPKFLALNANAICLWHEGKNYCDTHQTDGLVPRDAMKTFRFRGAKAIAMLLLSCGLKPDGTPYAPLWSSHEVGYRMHDYLDHNDCREAVLARMDQAEKARELDREYKRRGRAAKKEKRERVRSGQQPDSPVDRPVDVRLYTETETTTETKKEPRTAPGGAVAQPHPVKEFLALHEAQFVALSGDKPAKYGGREAKIAKGAIDQYGLEKAKSLLIAFFASRDPFIVNSGYGLNVFAGQINKLLAERGPRRVGTPERSTVNLVDEWGYCFHEPRCTDSDICRAKRATEKASA